MDSGFSLEGSPPMVSVRNGSQRVSSYQQSPPYRCLCGRSVRDARRSNARHGAGAVRRTHDPFPAGVVVELHGGAVGGLAEGQQVTGTLHLTPTLTGLPAQWVDVLVDGELRWTLDRAPYAVDWNTALETSGDHVVVIRAVAVGGLVAQVAVHVTVAGGQAADRRTLLAQTTQYRAQTWAFQTLMRVPKSAVSAPLQGTLAELVQWRSRAAAARARVSHPPHFGQWMCIHSHEAAWTSHDSGHNGHYGGLQMSFDFMRGYGPELYGAKGTADHWTPLEQIWVAERAWQVRGYNPWPTTARMCGLLR